MTIQSNLSRTSSIATGIANSSANISGVVTGGKDTVSHYNGNTDAATHIDREATYNAQIAEALSQFVQLIHSTASEFEAVDQSLANTTASSLQGPPSQMDTNVSQNGLLPTAQRLMVD